MSSTVHSMYCEFGEQGLGYIIIQIIMGCRFFQLCLGLQVMKTRMSVMTEVLPH